MAYDGAPQEIAAPGEEEPCAGIRPLTALYDEILGMDIERVRRASAHGGHRIVVRAQEIAHIHQLTEIIALHRIDQLLHPQAVLGEVAMVLGHGLYPFPGSIFRDGPAACRQPL